MRARSIGRCWRSTASSGAIAPGDRLGQRHLDEDQGLVNHGGMEEGVASPVDRIDAAAQVVPVADLVHGFVTDDLFEDVGRGRPVNPAQHEKPPVEPRREKVRDVAIERGEIGVTVHHAEQIGAHVDEIAGAARRAVEAADQLLPARLGGEMQRARVFVTGTGAPFFDRLGQAFAIGAEIAHQGFEEGAASCRIQLLVDVEHLTRHGGARSFATTGQQRTAELDQPVGIVLGVGGIPAAQQRAAAIGDGGEQV
ncbi:hypothetical protein ACVWXQ_004663 [Bradyrhizobium sp. S3.14.4]